MFRKALAGLLKLIPGAGGGGSAVLRGSASGRVYVGDESHELTHASAFDSRRDGELWVYLTDAPLSDKQVTKRFAVHGPARAGRVHGVKLRLDPEDSDPRSLSALLLMPPANEKESLASISSSGTDPRFERLSLPPAALAGKVRMDQEAIFESPPYGFEVEFEFPEASPA
jgi:hypothetical protein